MEWRDEAFLSIEHVQARLLVSIYERMKKSRQRAWMNAGRCFRLVQGMRLHEVDSPENIAQRNSRISDGGDWIHQEEKRRAFWVAFSLDLLSSVDESWSLTLHEHIVKTSLP